MSWVEKNDPWMAEGIYTSKDPNAWIDRVLLEYRKISFRLFNETSNEPEIHDALMQTMGAFEAAIAQYQGAISVGSEHPMASMTLLRESLHAILAIATDWINYPADDIPPSNNEVLDEVSKALSASFSFGDKEVPLSANFMSNVVNYNLASWPPRISGEGTYSFSAFIESVEDHPPTSILSSVTRIPLSIKALEKWRSAWGGYWMIVPDEWEVSDTKQSFGHWVHFQLKSEWEKMCETVDEGCPDWVEAILPWSSSLLEEE